MVAFIDARRDEHGVEPICEVLPLAPWPTTNTRPARPTGHACPHADAPTTDHLRTDLVLDALDQAVYDRLDGPAAELRAHFDAGTQYTAEARRGNVTQRDRAASRRSVEGSAVDRISRGAP